MRNPAFNHYIPQPQAKGIQSNVTRSLFHDSNGIIWASTKAGKLFFYRPDERLPFLSKDLEMSASVQNRSHNVYSIIQDHKGYVWLGSKGEGIARSNKPVNSNTKYEQLTFTWTIPTTTATESLTNRNVYSLAEDKYHRLWIGTFGAGLFMTPNNNQFQFTQITSANSNLSSDQIRHLWLDGSGNLWIATTFGINYLSKENIESQNYTFRNFLHNPNHNKSLSYNDVVHIFEDSNQHLWFTTFGGGVNLLESYINVVKLSPVHNLL
jgi:ligand-binding sensor domain-containing protein